ncbi:MAG: N-acetylmuramoyl-L-alanine amidase [Ignavibacteriae bacterium]|nr:N-acetylmuramoyl-L-alanine amidase [Ignavibacteriota bacterium]
MGVGIIHAQIQSKDTLIDYSSEATGGFTTKNIPVLLANVSPFLAVGIIASRDTSEGALPNLQLRYSNNETDWSGWQNVSLDEEGGKDSNEIAFSLQFLPKEAQVLQINIYLQTKGEKHLTGFQRLRISFISPGESEKGTPQKRKILQQTLFDEPPTFLSRTEWACPEGQTSPRWTPLHTNVTHLIVHHTAGSNSSSDWAAVVRSIWVYHANERGWGDIGYNWLIDPNGTLYQGRAWLNDSIEDVRGGHFCGVSPDPNGINNNEQTMGVSLLGTFTSNAPTDTAFKTLRDVLVWKTLERNLEPKDTSYHAPTGLTIPNISGHRVGCATACPGDSLYSRLPSVRLAVDSVVKVPFTTLNLQASKGWNLFSFPVELNDESEIQFPVGTSTLVRYNCGGGYSIEETLKAGKGYWIKFPTEGTVTISGVPRTSDTMNVACDWNIVGTLSEQTPADSVQTSPAGILASPFYGYALGICYYVADTLMPFQAYWVKVQQAGNIILHSPSTTMNSDR